MSRQLPGLYLVWFACVILFTVLAWYLETTLFTGGFHFLWSGFSKLAGGALLGFCFGGFIVLRVMSRFRRHKR